MCIRIYDAFSRGHSLHKRLSRARALAVNSQGVCNVSTRASIDGLRMMDTPTLDILVINNAGFSRGAVRTEGGNHYSPVQSPVNK